MAGLKSNEAKHSEYEKGQEVNVIDLNPLKKKQRPKAVPVHGKIIFVSNQIITVDHGSYKNSYQRKDIERNEVIITVVGKLPEQKAV